MARICSGRRAAAAADDIDQAFARKVLDLGRHEVGAFVILAERVGQAGVGIGADERIRDAESSARCGRMAAAPSAQFSPTVNGLAWRIECQKAVGVWPDSVRPDRSVMVPEIMTGSQIPFSANISSQAKIAALAFSVSKIVSIRMMSAPPSISPRSCSP